MDATHLRWFTEKSLRALLEHNGLAILEMSQSAGLFLPAYSRRPFSYMPKKLRRALIRLGTRTFPRLFGCQHVVKAQVPF
jgi:hypothetical protein